MAGFETRTRWELMNIVRDIDRTDQKSIDAFIKTFVDLATDQLKMNEAPGFETRPSDAAMRCVIWEMNRRNDADVLFQIASKEPSRRLLIDYIEQEKMTTPNLTTSFYLKHINDMLQSTTIQSKEFNILYDLISYNVAGALLLDGTSEDKRDELKHTLDAERAATIAHITADPEQRFKEVLEKYNSLEEPLGPPRYYGKKAGKMA